MQIYPNCWLTSTLRGKGPKIWHRVWNYIYISRTYVEYFWRLKCDETKCRRDFCIGWSLLSWLLWYWKQKYVNRHSHRDTGRPWHTEAHTQTLTYRDIDTHTLNMHINSGTYMQRISFVCERCSVRCCMVRSRTVSCVLCLVLCFWRLGQGVSISTSVRLTYKNLKILCFNHFNY